MPKAPERACKPNLVLRLSRAAIIHLGRSLPNGSSDLPGNAARLSPDAWAGSPIRISLFGLAPRGVYPAAGVTTHAGELLPHRFTHHLLQGWFVFCCTCRHPVLPGCPDVIRLVALWCSDFPLSFKSDCPARSGAWPSQYNKEC